MRRFWHSTSQSPIRHWIRSIDVPGDIAASCACAKARAQTADLRNLPWLPVALGRPGWAATAPPPQASAVRFRSIDVIVTPRSILVVVESMAAICFHTSPQPFVQYVTRGSPK